MIDTRDPQIFVSKSIEQSLSDQIIKYEDSQLEKKYPDFRYLVKEFHDGILLFEISGDKVWNKSQADSSGLMAYYESNKNEYLSKPGIEAVVYSCLRNDKMKSMVKSFNRYRKYRDIENMMYRKFTINGDTILDIKKGIWYQNDDREIDNLKWDKNVQEVNIWGHPAIVEIKNRIESQPLPFKEVSGEIINGYQEYLENSWIKQLRSKYPVKIDNNVLEEVRKYLDSE